ncbi:stage III sporulation protein AD [Desulfohalotomaculum tongense]|uniref:stage III sporulation protein AD n=1 Tax=Desulforadius tongensis TaxID=1216062 RepID=UPI00195792C5|nr:stage III sporulation protein AD [Desulforadius tongensis]MBM7855482.1 stage III sporulation protein AD [Desulforadius tongensis]
MEIMQIIGIALVTTILAGIIKFGRSEMGVLLSLTAGLIIFFMVLGPISSVFQVLKDLANRANISMAYLGTILKIVGIAYIADFGAQICRDAGEGALAAKVEFAAKILVLVLAVPIIVAVLQALLKIIPT